VSDGCGGAIALRISSMVYGAGLREVVTRETVSIISAWRINNGQGGRLIRSPHGHSKPSRNEAAPGAVRAEKTGGVRKKRSPTYLMSASASVSVKNFSNVARIAELLRSRRTRSRVAELHVYAGWTKKICATDSWP